MTAQSHRIFVSHSHLDNDFGTRFAQDLRSALKEESAVWYDVLGGLHGGETWWEKIVEELTARDVFIVVLSPDSMNSNWVRREITMAFNENKYVLPVLYRSCSIRADLKILQIISFLAPKLYNQAFGEVLFALGISAGTPVEPREQASALGDPAAALLGQLQAAFDIHDWPDVIRKADYLIKHMPARASAQVYRLQGVAYLEEGDEQQAQEAFETALALVSQRELRLTLLSDSTALLAKQGQWTKVQQRAREALRLVPNDPGWLATQQQAQRELAKQAPIKFPSSEQEPMRDQQPATPPLRGRKTKEQWLNESNDLNNSKRYEEALAACEQALRLDPTYALAYYNKGAVLRQLKRYQEAISALDQAIRLDPTYANAYENKGWVLNELKRHEEAIFAYDQAIRLDPNRTNAYYNKGVVLRELKRYEEAISAFDQTIRLDSNDAEAYQNKGWTLERLGKQREAQQAYAKARQLGYTG
jgi:tetratricopeptide (TPR) repeat protein